MRAQFVVELLPQRSTVCLSFDYEDVLVQEIKEKLHVEHNIPTNMMQLMHGTRCLHDCLVPQAPHVVKVICGRGLLGGKGGFGAMLRSQGKGAGARATTDFGSCRDLSGRRLRHVNQEIAMQKWNEEEGLRAQRKREGIDERELPVEQTPSGIAGWYLNTPSWAEGFGKKAASRMRRKRKTIMCSSWTQARARATPPPNAPVWWGCPRGENCNYAHGESELRGEELTLYKKQQKEEKLREKERSLDEYIHPIAPGALENEVQDAFLAGLKRRAELQANHAAQKSELQTKLIFTPGEAKWGSTTVASVAGSWLVPLNGNIHVEQTSTSSNALAEGRGTFGTATVFGCALHSGIWYYEIELLTEGVIQVGWADSSFEADDEEGDGVGDHKSSWAYDGCRQVKWTNGVSASYGEKWCFGDIIGCSLDIEAGKISFSKNGVNMGVAFNDVQFTKASENCIGGLFPAFSLEEKERIRINIGDHPFAFAPKTPFQTILSALTKRETNAESPSTLEAESVDESKPNPTPQVTSHSTSNSQKTISTPVEAHADKNSTTKSTPNDVKLEDLMSYESVESLMELGMDKLRDELKNRGLKCGGTLQQRAERLFSIRGKNEDEIPGKLKAR